MAKSQKDTNGSSGTAPEIFSSPVAIWDGLLAINADLQSEVKRLLVDNAVQRQRVTQQQTPDARAPEPAPSSSLSPRLSGPG
jgi:hypothetical protein